MSDPIPSPQEWIFDPVPPSGAIRGGIPVAYVFTPELEVFVREVLQNAYDQKLPGSTASVDIDLISLSGQDLDRFLDALRWTELRRHVMAVAESGALNAGPLEDATNRLDGGDRLLLLRVTDASTTGLTGEEDANGSNYKALVRNVLDTSEEHSQRGGSHGLGKAVLWSFSQLGTVLFSSVIDWEGARHFRFVGRTDLSHHWTNSEQWDGPGWLGRRDPEKERAVSMWGDDARHVARALNLYRSNAETGTSILIVGFFEPRQESARDVTDIASDISLFAARNFWPAIVKGSLVVRTRIISNGEVTAELPADPDENILPFIRAAQAADPAGLPARATEAGQVAERVISIEVPGRLGGPDEAPTPPRTALGRLRILRAPEDDSGLHVNRVALVRGAGMVVQYWRPNRVPLSGGGFYGVFEAGLALEGLGEFDDAYNVDLEQFLRACEPPAHDRWDPHTPRVRSRYKPGAVARVRELWDNLTTSVIAMCEQRPPDQTDGPDRLKKLFRIGKQGPPPTGKFRVTYDHGASRFDASLGVWILAASVHRVAASSDRPWIAELAVQLEGDAGLGTHLRIEDVAIDKGTDATVAVENGHWRIDVKPIADDVSFVIRAGGTEGPSLGLRNRVRLKVSSREGSEA